MFSSLSRLFVYFIILLLFQIVLVCLLDSGDFLVLNFFIGKVDGTAGRGNLENCSSKIFAGIDEQHNNQRYVGKLDEPPQVDQSSEVESTSW